MVSGDTFFLFSVSDTSMGRDYRNPAKTLESQNAEK